MTLEEFAELVLTMRLAQDAARDWHGEIHKVVDAEVAVDEAVLMILPDTTIRSATTGRIILNRLPRSSLS